MIINVQNVHRWNLIDTHTPVDAYGSLSQNCQWLSPVMQTKLTKVNFKTRELVWAFVAAFVKTPTFPPKPDNPVD